MRTYGQTDGRTDMTKQLGASLNYENSCKIHVTSTHTDLSYSQRLEKIFFFFSITDGKVGGAGGKDI